MKFNILVAGLLVGTTLGAVSAHAQDLAIPKGEPGFSWDSLEAFAAAHTDLAGQELTIWNAWAEPSDKAQFEAVLSYFIDATGIKVQNGSSKNYEEQARIDIAAGSPANVTILPQPGLLADFAAQGALVDLGAETTDWLTANYSAGESWAALGQYAGPDGTKAQYAFPYKQEVKSLVWYSPDNFAEMGYEIPETFEDLLALQDQIVADAQESDVRHDMLLAAMDDLNERERNILQERRLAEEPKTLEELSQVYGVSRERVRQIEVRAFEKLQRAMMRIAGDRRLVPVAG